MSLSLGMAFGLFLILATTCYAEEEPSFQLCAFVSMLAFWVVHEMHKLLSLPASKHLTSEELRRRRVEEQQRRAAATPRPVPSNHLRNEEQKSCITAKLLPSSQTDRNASVKDKEKKVKTKKFKASPLPSEEDTHVTNERPLSTIIDSTALFYAQRHSQELRYEMAAAARQDAAELRRQQDEEYQLSLEKDREREQEKIKRAESLQADREFVGPEPPPSDEGNTTIRFCFSSGKRVCRRFLANQPLAVLKAFLRLHGESHPSSVPTRVALSSNFPKRSYDSSDDNLTLQSAGLYPQAVLMVCDLDA